MTSSFSGLIRASRALAAQSYARNVTGQNIANSDTGGYSRQRADRTAVAAMAGVPSLYATREVTTGVSVTGTIRMDAVLDARARGEHGRNSYAHASSAQVCGIEGLFNEPGDTGLAEQLNNLWNAWATLSNDPANVSRRAGVLLQSSAVASSLSTTSADLASLALAAADQLSQTVTDINTVASALAQVNGAIAIASTTGANSNALADQRDSLLLKLSDAAGVSASIQVDGSATVRLGGASLVVGNVVSAASVVGNQFTVGGNAAGIAGGQAQALIDALTTTLPHYSAQLDAVAAALVGAVNAAHQAGYDQTGARGAAFFSGTSASTIAVALTSTSQVAAAAVAGITTDAACAAALANLGTIIGGADEKYATLVTTLGSDVQRAKQVASRQAAVTTNVDAQKQAANGLSFDQVTTNLLAYQRAYQESARVLTTIDSMLDELADPQAQVSSRRLITRPSDDPTGTAAALSLRADLKRSAQYATNAADAQGWLNSTDSTLADTISTLRKVRSLVLQGLSTDANAGHSNAAIAQQVDTLRRAVLSLANATHLGRPIFGGTTAGTIAFDASGTFVGDSGAVTRTVGPNTTVPANAIGSSVFGPNGSNVFDVLSGISTALQTNDMIVLNAGLGALETATSAVASAQGHAGALSARVKDAWTLNSITSGQLLSQLSGVQDIDLADMAIKVSSADAAYQTALATTAMVRQTSLLDFLK